MLGERLLYYIYISHHFNGSALISGSPAELPYVIVQSTTRERVMLTSQELLIIVPISMRSI